jgi:hypothetical protein
MAQVNIGNATVRPGDIARIEVRLIGDNVAGTQNDIIFDDTIVDLPSLQACTINPAIGVFPNGQSELSCLDDPSIGPCKVLRGALKRCGTFLQPDGCPPGSGSSLSVFRGIVAVAALLNDHVIPSGSVLYTCEFNVVDAERLPSILTNSNVVVANVQGRQVPSSAGSGVVELIPPSTDTPSPSPTRSSTPSPSGTSTATHSPSVTPSLTATCSPTSTSTETPTGTPTPVRCFGDCDRNDRVTVDEIVTLVGIALGSPSVDACLSGDGDGDGRITVDEILRAVRVALDGCNSL